MYLTIYIFTFILEENLIRRIKNDVYTTMSQAYGNMNSSKAIDFDDRSKPDYGCCSASTGGNAWWKLDLGSMYPIKALIFVGRSDGK